MKKMSRMLCLLQQSLIEKFHEQVAMMQWRERDTPMFNIWLYPQQVRVARFTSTHQQSDLRKQFTSSSNVHLPFSSQPHTFSLNLHFPCPLSDLPLSSLSSFGLQPQDRTPFSRHDHPTSSTHDHPLSSTHDHTNEDCLP